LKEKVHELKKQAPKRSSKAPTQKLQVTAYKELESLSFKESSRRQKDSSKRSEVQKLKVKLTIVEKEENHRIAHQKS
jgi:hypothetical protein